MAPTQTDGPVQTPFSRTADVVVITGMSGSGRSRALQVFEDMGYYCIDNLPPRLMVDLANVVGINAGIGRHLAVICDLRSQGLFDEMDDALRALEDHELSWTLLFLDCPDDVLIRRYKETRRRHPIARQGEPLEKAIARERAQLARIRERAGLVIDTGQTRPQELAENIRHAFSELSDQQLLDVRVFSFGFKHGMPASADLLIDVRFLPNPFYEPELRNLNGNDPAVERYVMEKDATRHFLSAWYSLLDVVMPGYVSEGKTQLSIGLGCTGGQHRSVVMANATAHHLGGQGYRVSLSHRDLPRQGQGGA